MHKNVPAPAPMVKSFLIGLLTPSAVAVGSAVVVAAGLLCALAIVVDEEFVRDPCKSRYLLAGREDYDVIATSGILRLAAHRQDRPLVLLVGASDAYCMIDPRRFEESLARAGWRSEDVCILTQNGQGLEQASVIAGAVPDDVVGVLVLCLNISKYCKAENESDSERDAVRLGIRNSRLEASSAAFPGALLWRNREFYGPRIRHLARNLMFGPPDLEPFDRFDDDPPLAERLWVSRGERYRKRLDRMEELAPRGLRRIAEIRDDLSRRTRVSVVAITLPLSPRFIAEFPGEDRYRRYDALARDGLALLGIPHVHLDELAVPAQAYWDWIHLKSADARAVVTDRIAAAVLDQFAAIPESRP